MMTTTSENTLKRKKESPSNTNDLQSRILRSLGEGDSYYDESAFPSEAAVEILKRLDEQIVYLPRELFKFRIFHKMNRLPRDKAFYGDVQADGSYPLYRYENQKDAFYPEVQPWTPELEQLRDQIFERTGQRCNHCVVNQYRDNNDHIGFHFDKNRDFVKDSNVITLSFGGQRLLRLKHNKTHVKEDIHVKAGSLFFLGWKTNSIWKHSIVKTKSACERRVSLTFRSIKTIKHKDGTLTEADSSNFFDSNHESNRTKKIKTEETQNGESSS